MDARTIIDQLENRYNGSRNTAQALGISFGLYLHWITSPELIPPQAKRMLSFRAALLGRNIKPSTEVIAA
jgi:hypothetical protein